MGTNVRRCFSCNKPLTLDSSLLEHGTAAPAAVDAAGPSSFASCSSDGLVPSTSAVALGGLCSFVQIAERMLHIIAQDQSGVEHPLCRCCADHLMDYVDQSLLKAEDDCRDYRRILSNLEGSEVAFSSDVLQEQLVALVTEENSLKQELLDMERLDKDLDEQIDREEENVSKIVEKEDQLWRMYRDCRRKIQDSDLEIRGARNQLAYVSCMLDRLTRTDVFSLTFRIWHSGPFGVINGFRLGRTPGQTVDWPEINAAFGQCVLLLYSLIRKVQLDLKGYQLVPFGSYSYIRSLRDGKELRVFTEGGAKFTWYPKLDQAIVAFVDCLHQLEEHIRLKVGGDYNLPHRMQEDKLEDGGHDYSVKTHLNSEERWTKAMKCLLTNLKWALAWVASVAQLRL